MTTTTDSFQPNYGSGVTVAPTASSASSSLGNGSLSIVYWPVRVPNTQLQLITT